MKQFHKILSYKVKTISEIAKSFSVSLAFWNLEYEVCSKLHTLEKFSKIAFKKKQKYIFAYLDNNYANIVEQYVIKNDRSSDVEGEFPIWFFWYQDFDTAPDLVKACFVNLKKKNEGSTKVHLVTRENITEYIQLPEWILKKAGKEISFTHFSDVVRVALLAQWGGAWIDSTCFCSKPLPEEVKKNNFYSCKTLNVNLPLPANSEWVTWLLITGRKNYKLFCFVRDIWYAYWERENGLIDYLFTDFIIRYAYQRYSDIRRDIQSVPENNTDRNTMMMKFGEPYKEDYLTSKDDTWIYKLSYKKNYPLIIDRHQTFYGKLSADEL